MFSLLLVWYATFSLSLLKLLVRDKENVFIALETDPFFLLFHLPSELPHRNT